MSVYAARGGDGGLGREGDLARCKIGAIEDRRYKVGQVRNKKQNTASKNKWNRFNRPCLV